MRNPTRLIQRLSAGTALGLILLATAAQAAPDTSTKATDNDAIETLVVTGQRGVQRTVADSPTPIDVVTAADLERTARPDLIAQLNEIIPSFNSPAKGGNGSTYVVQTGGLRGLNVDQTLVLVNGKRRHRSAHINVRGFQNSGSVPVDLALIPTSSVERVEVLRDGAAAQYGSDAIAGVINLILKDHGDGGRINLQYGANFDEGDGQLYRVDAHKGFSLPHGATLDLSFDGKKQQGSTRAERLPDNYQLYPLVNGARDPREATINRLVEPNYGQTPQWGVNFSYDLSVPVNDKAEIYSFGTYGYRVSTLVWNFRAPTNVNSLIELYPNGFNPIAKLREADFDVALGAKGEAAGWDWDLSSAVGVDQIRYYGENTLNASLGPSSPTSFYYGKLQSTDWSNSLDVTRAFDLNGAKLQASWGLQHRFERYAIGEGEPLSYAAGTYVIPAGQPLAGQRPAPGAQGQITFQPSEAVQAHRNSWAAYVDLGLDLTERWFVGGALRHESFDDSAGDTTIGKLTTRYEITPKFALRGAFNTGFKAPALAQEYYASTTSTWKTVGATQVLNMVKFLPVGSAAAKALGSKPLTPETSTSYSLGFTYNPIENLTVTLDSYSIEVDDRITLTEQLSGTAVQAILTASGVTSQIDSAQYFTNAIDTRTRGVDLVATYRQDLGDWGRLTYSLGGNYNKTKILHVIDNPPELTALGSSYVLFGRTVRGYLTRSPKTKVNFTTNWRKDKWTVTTQLNRWGAYEQIGTTTADDAHVKAKIITNLDVSYAFKPNATISIGASNLFNVYPDKIAAVTAGRGTGQYPTGTGFGFTGGSYYVRLGVDF